MAREKEIKNIAEAKAGEQPGTFSGRASVYGVVDSYGDVVARGAFTQTLREKGGRIKVLSQHDPSDVIGIATLTDKSDALWAYGTLELELQSAKDAYIRLKSGLIDGISIGYVTRESHYEGGNRILTDIDLWEVSLVTFPANDEARVTGVKHSGSDLARLTALVEEMNFDLSAQTLLQKMNSLKVNVTEAPDATLRRLISEAAQMNLRLRR